ncbi:MAG TPA: alpha/beta hydrolase [Humisphaera sp.]|nr:alpha/beta hydrolase [Humisphaera sp.]
MAWAELSDCRCFYEVHGDGEPLILIPGLAATSQMWDPVAADFAQFFSVIQFDNRGVGKSIAKRDAKTLPDLVSDIVELFDRLQLDRAHVLGVSLGGIIAQRLAIDHPSRVGRLVLVSCCDTFSPYLRQMSSLLAHTLRRFPKEMFIRTLELLATAPEFLDAHSDVVEQRVLHKCRNRVSARAVGNQMRCLATAEMAPDHYRIHSPTLVVAGEYDPIIPSCYSKRMADKIPGSKYMLVRGAGHNPIIDHPRDIIPNVIEFLRADEVDGEQLQTIESFVPYFGGFSAGVVHGGDVS